MESIIALTCSYMKKSCVSCTCMGSIPLYQYLHGTKYWISSTLTGRNIVWMHIIGNNIEPRAPPPLPSLRSCAEQRLRANQSQQRASWRLWPREGPKPACGPPRGQPWQTAAPRGGGHWLPRPLGQAVAARAPGLLPESHWGRRRGPGGRG